MAVTVVSMTSKRDPLRPCVAGDGNKSKFCLVVLSSTM